VDRTFSITEAATAHRYLEAETNTGRVILTTSDDDWPAVASPSPYSAET